MSTTARVRALLSLAGLALGGAACGERGDGDGDRAAPAATGAPAASPTPASATAGGDPTAPPATATAATGAAGAATPGGAAAATPPLPPDRGEHRGEHRWSTRIGGVLADAGRAVAVDGTGNVAVVGYLRDAVDLGGGQRLAADGADGFVALFDRAGALRWAKSFGGKEDDSIAAVAFDPAGNVLVGGAFSYELAMADGKLTSKGADDAFVVKLAPDGRRLWAKRFGGPDVDAVYGLATDATGEVYVTGEFGDEADFGTTRLKSAGAADAFVVKLGDAGEVRWARRLGGVAADYGRAVAVGPGGPVLLAEVSREVDLGAGEVAGAGNRDVAVVALDGAGVHRWATRFGGGNDELALGLAIDPVGSVALTGLFDGDLTFGAERIKAVGLADAFVAKLSPAGAPLWIRVFGSKEADIGGGVASDAAGNLYAVGWFWYTIDFGKGPLESAGRKDAYAVALGPDGRTLWSRRYGARESDFLQGVAVGSDGAPVAVGTFHGAVDFGGGALAAAGAPKAALPLGDVAVVGLGR